MASPFAYLTAVILLAAAQPSHSAAHTPHCPHTQAFAIGSFNRNRFRPDFQGAGITFATFSHNAVNITSVLPPGSIGDNPSYNARNGRALYTCNSVLSGSVTQITPHRGPPYLSVRSASLPNQQPSHIAVLPTLRLVLTANVEEGTVYSFRTGKKLAFAGSYTVPKKLATQVMYPDAGISNRQRTPHPHMVLPIRGGVIVPDLGADRIHFLHVSSTGALKLQYDVRVQRGDGPRHAVAHSSAPTVYVVNELSRTMVVLGRSPNGRMEVKSRHALLDKDVEGTAAAIRLSADGRFLYASVRLDMRDEPLHGRIVGFALRKDGGVERKIGEWSCHGAHPRDFIIVEKLWVRGKCHSYIAVANRDSNEVVFLRRTVASGFVGDVDLRFSVRTPTSVLQL